MLHNKKPKRRQRLVFLESRRQAYGSELTKLGDILFEKSIKHAISDKVLNMDFVTINKK